MNDLRHRLVPAVLIVACVLVAAALRAADDDGKGEKPPATPKSAKARTARQRLDAAMTKADEAWRQAAVAAHREYVKAMEDALKAAGTAGNTDDVTLIAAALAEGKEKLAELDRRKGRGPRNGSGGATAAGDGGNAKSGRVLASKAWQPVLKVKKGQVLKITAKGEWQVSASRGLRSGPDGIDEEYEGQPLGMLIARIGNKAFVVGAEAEIEVPANGMLEMMCNDAEGHFEDNAGHLDVTIEVE